MRVYWFEQTEHDVPGGGEWLSAAESARLNSLRIPKRRADWRLGRWTAKCAVTLHLGLASTLPALSDIELRPASTGAPEIYVAGLPASVAVSLSHRSGMAACAIAPCGVALGCDLESLEPRSDVFVGDFFTADERELVQRSGAHRDRMAALIWSAKESALKALRVGLRLDTRSVAVSFPAESAFLAAPGDWHHFAVRHSDGAVAEGWWQHDGAMLRTLVASPPALLPPAWLECSAFVRT